MGGLDPRRLAKIRVRTADGVYRVATGYALTRDLLLTARHTWLGQGGEAHGVAAEVRFMGDGEAWVGASVDWCSDEDVDACLLRLHRARALKSSVAYGAYDRRRPVAWSTTGFPAASEVGSDEPAPLRDSADLRGWVSQHGAAERDLLELTVDGPPEDAESWAGVSGAPVFAAGHLVGWIRSVPRRFAGTRLYATPIGRLMPIHEVRERLGAPRLARIPVSVLSDNMFELPPIESPAALLNARYQVVPFFEASRRAELDVLEAFCESDAPLGIRLITGPGGAGKTRLLIEWCKRLRQRGWEAGFLPDRLSDDALDALLAGPAPVLIAVDYAETRPSLGEELSRLVTRTALSASRVRVLLLAREQAGWWQSLLGRGGELRDHLEHGSARELGTIMVDGPMRGQVFEAARERFASIRGVDLGPSTASVALEDRHFGRALYLHMAALAAVEGLELAAETLIERVLDHEQRFWVRAVKLSLPSDLERQAFEATARRAVGAFTLMGGASSEEQARRTLKRAAGPKKGFAAVLRQLYPGRGQPDAADAYLAGLEPDLLGEALVARVLSDPETPREYLDQVFEGADMGAVRTGFVVLGRVALRVGETAERWIERLLDKDVASRTQSAFDAAIALGEQSAFAPVGKALAGSLKREGSLEHARSLEPMLPTDTVSLREVAVWVFETLLRHAPVGDKEDVLQERARLLNNLGNRLSELGRREAALAATEEAVTLYRRLAEARPTRSCPTWPRA